MLSAKNIKKSYHSLEVLKGIDMEVQRGEVVSIVGASGAGKSTLLHILGTLDLPDHGSLHIDGKSVGQLASNELARFRNKHLGFVFQSHNLLPEFSALENICLPGWIGGGEQDQVAEKALKLMEILHIKGREGHKPAAMSGGEQQRTAVARALINSPTIIFADEPSGNLDSKNAEELHQLFFRLRDEFGQTFVIVTHNEEFAEMADRKLTITDGLI